MYHKYHSMPHTYSSSTYEFDDVVAGQTELSDAA